MKQNKLTSRLIIIYLLFLWCLGACQPSYVYQLQATEGFTEVNTQLVPDSTVEAFIQPYKQQLDTQMKRVIGYSAQELPKERNGTETLLGNFVADVMLAEAQKKTSTPIDMAVVTFGGLRVSLPEGAITVDKIFELMPFENEIWVVTVDYNTVKQLFAYMIDRENTAIANTKILVENKQMQDALIGGEPFDDRNYTIAISDYLANGGDDMNFLQNRTSTEKLNLKVRDAIILHIETLQSQNKEIKVEIEQRVMIRDE